MAFVSFHPVRSLAGILRFALLAHAALRANGEPVAPGAKPFTSTVVFAQAHHVALDGFEIATGSDARFIQTGDRLTVLFAVIEENGAGRQWLTEVKAVALTEREVGTKPGTGLGILGFFQSSLKTDTGHEYSFAQSPVALEIRTTGPFIENAPARDSELTTTVSRVLATRDYLAHGLAPMADIELRLRAAGKQNPGISLMFRPKYSEAQMAATKARVKEAGFTEADERAYAEAIYAIVQFGNLGFKTPGMDAITLEIADSPTLFSGAFTNLNWPAMEIEDGKNWGLPDSPVFRVPFNFYSKTQAHGFFYVTHARPPLQNMAGIVGLTIDGTSKKSGRRLVMRVISGRRSPTVIVPVR